MIEILQKLWIDASSTPKQQKKVSEAVLSAFGNGKKPKSNPWSLFMSQKLRKKRSKDSRSGVI